MSEFNSRSRKVPARGTIHPSAEQSLEDFVETDRPVGFNARICMELGLWIGQAADHLRQLGFDFDEIESRILNLARVQVGEKIAALRRAEVVAAVRAGE